MAIKQSFDIEPVAAIEKAPVAKALPQKAPERIEPRMNSGTGSMACLFAASRTRFGQDGWANFEGENIRAKSHGSAMFKLETSSISESDGRIFGHGELYVIPKTPTTPRSVPDLKGWLNDPERHFHYEISARWATTRNGATYLRMWMQKTDGIVQML
ncbi:hypothetical protein KDW40_01765 [Burkholderia cenocepacia]|uniref:hypothetical protein n=1 Tax=Burkholderia TaxID=32008 RepID=UPI0005C5D297|nr:MULTISPECIES: hypothetical protein [Burkholderia]MBR8043174.1 hypothetical protein [Burkholderia cenocepacia]MBR8324456.1 hypothetical protein [Burkholderia cenocepacia]